MPLSYVDEYSVFDDAEYDRMMERLAAKGGKPSPGTPKDGRLKENKPPADKKPFPGAGKPFPKKP
jgi:hypothetical protein